VAEGWSRDDILRKLKDETLSRLESDYIEPLLEELRGTARRFDLLAEGCRESNDPELRGMAPAMELAAGMVDDLLDEALETSLRRAVEENAWADPQQLSEE